MISDTDFAPDDFEIEEGFKEMLSKLSASKESITRASKYALENSSYSQPLFQLIVKQLKKSTTKRKIALFYLVDSIVQYSRTKAKDRYVKQIANELPKLVNIMVLPTVKEIESPTEMNLDQCKSVVKKVLNLWEERNALAIGEISFTECIKEAYLELENPTQSLSPIKRKKHKMEEEEDIDEIIRKIEEHRKETKRQRWESKLRPETEPEFTQMEEIWSKISLEDIRNEIRDYDRRMAHYGNGPALLSAEDEPTPHKVQPSPFSPSSSLSSPSPSPSTPYSPSNPIKPSNTFKKDSRHYSVPTRSDHKLKEFPPKESSKAPKVDVYSPSSPSSSPEANRKNKNAPPSSETTTSPVKAIANSPSVPSRNSPIPTQNFAIPTPVHNTPYIFVWDLDDALMPWTSLDNEEYARSSKKNAQLGVKLYGRLNSLLYKAMDRFMFFRQIEKIDVEPNITTFLAADDGKNLRDHDFTTDKLFRTSISSSFDPVKLAYRYRIIKDMYEGTIDVRKLFARGLWEEIVDVCQDIDKFTDGWLVQARKCIQAASENDQITNIVITSGQLIPSLARLISLRLAEFIPIENVYSARSSGKRACLAKIREKYNNKLLVIASGREEELFCKNESIPFWKVSSPPDLGILANKLQRNLDSVLFS